MSNYETLLYKTLLFWQGSSLKILQITAYIAKSVYSSCFKTPTLTHTRMHTRMHTPTHRSVKSMKMVDSLGELSS